MSSRPRILVGLLAALLLVGCSSTAQQAQPPASGEPIVASSGPIPTLVDSPELALPATVTDADGNEVTISDISRIVSLSGGVTELLFALGLQDKVVGRDVTSDLPGAQSIPLVSQGHDINAEGVLALNPSLIIADTTTGPPETIEALRKVGVPVLIVPEVWSIADALPRARLLTDALGMSGVYPALADALGGKVDQLKEPLTIAFLYLRGTAAVYLMGGKGSGGDSVIEAMGGVDAGTKAGLQAFTPLTPEALAASAPDVLMVMEKGLSSVGGVDGLLKLPGVAQTPAGKSRAIVSVPDGELLSFGPRTTGMLNGIVSQLNQLELARSSTTP